MTPTAPGKGTGPARIHALSVRNYRALRNVGIRNIAPLAVFVGPNGSGKSTLFDVFAFLSECFNDGLRRAWDRRGRFKELRSRDSSGPIVIELKYREGPGQPLITYRLEIDERKSGPIVKYEMLRWKRKRYGAPFKFLEALEGKTYAVKGDTPDEKADRELTALAEPDLLAVNTLGQFEQHPRVRKLREFITSWHLSYLAAQETRGAPEAGPQEHLSRTGGNIANVIQYLQEQHPERFSGIIEKLVRRVPKLEQIHTEFLADGRLMLQIKDAPFDRPILARYASDGTLKMLAYLVLIHDPDPPQLIGIEEPENFLYPTLLHELSEECLMATRAVQLMVTTHSPFFINPLHPEHVHVLSRGDDGYTRVTNAGDIKGISEFLEEGGALGDLWMEGHFGSLP